MYLHLPVIFGLVVRDFLISNCVLIVGFLFVISWLPGSAQASFFSNGGVGFAVGLHATFGLFGSSSGRLAVKNHAATANHGKTAGHTKLTEIS